MNSDSENEEEYIENQIIFYETLSEDSYTDNDEVSEYDVDSDDDEMEEIYNEDLDYISTDKEDKKYYIGLCGLTDTYTMLLMNTVSLNVYLKYSHDKVLKYLIEYSLCYLHNPKIHILQLHIDPLDNTYKVVIKTHWIRLIQRTWRSVLKERKRVIQIRSKVSSIMNYQICGKHPPGATYYPTLRGMLSIYDKVNEYPKLYEFVKCPYYECYYSQ
jgi:hypothetical protein